MSNRIRFTQVGMVQHLEIEGQDISKLCRTMSFEAQAGEVPRVVLELIPTVTGGAVDVPELLADLQVIDTHDTLNLRQYLAEACDLCEKLLSLMTDEQIAEVLKTRDTARQIRLWKVHAEGPDHDMSLRTYREKVARANATGLDDDNTLDGPMRDALRDA